MIIIKKAIKTQKINKIFVQIRINKLIKILKDCRKGKKVYFKRIKSTDKD